MCVCHDGGELSRRHAGRPADRGRRHEAARIGGSSWPDWRLEATWYEVGRWPLDRRVAPFRGNDLRSGPRRGWGRRPLLCQRRHHSLISPTVLLLRGRRDSRYSLGEQTARMLSGLAEVRVKQNAGSVRQAAERPVTRPDRTAPHPSAPWPRGASGR